jgi:predicted RNase H-like HicB family nuclease
MKEKKVLTIKEYKLPVTLTEEDGYFIAICNEWKDCYAQGNTLEEAITEINYVAVSLIELYQEEGMKVPLKLKSTSKKQTNRISFTFPLIVSTN